MRSGVRVWARYCISMASINETSTNTSNPGQQPRFSSIPASPSIAPWFQGARRARLAGAHGLKKTIFEEVSDLARLHESVNLGQGVPDNDAPDEIVDIAQQMLARGHHQYAPAAGVQDLRVAIAEHQQSWYRVTVDPDAQVVVTSGATEAIAAAVLAFARPGDNVVTFEPFYDAYAALTGFARVELRTVPMVYDAQTGSFQPDCEALAQAVDQNTRMIIVNDPHNPTGSVFSPDSRQAIVRAAIEASALILSDEVYEHLVYNQKGDERLGLANGFVPFAHTPGAWERTISVSSAGKTFSLTGWKVGWATGPAQLIDALRTVKQYLTFSTGPMFQPAIAHGLRLPREFFTRRAVQLGEKVNVLVDALEDAGAKVVRPRGGYFVLADMAPLGIEDATELAQVLPEKAGVAAVPVSAFTTPEFEGRFASYLRFAACKDQASVEEGAKRLRASLADVAQAVAGESAGR